MAKFEKVAKVIGRMCKSVCDCSKCPIGKAKDVLGLPCLFFVYRYPEETRKIVMQWAEEHPVMTNRRKFAEVFGFNIATMFEVNRGNAEWLDEEYKGENKNG